MIQQIEKRIDRLIKEKEQVIIAIDGMCAAGKSTLADKIKQKYQAQIIRIDDFYLPEELRTEERYATPGGNVHYERFLKEIIRPLQNKESISYRPFNCEKMEYGDVIEIPKASVYVIEGTYSMREEFRELYDLTIYMECEEKTQLRRIRRRNGKEKYEIFRDKWIPLEQMYFERLGIKEQCELQFSTSKSKKELVGRSI